VSHGRPTIAPQGQRGGGLEEDVPKPIEAV